MTQAQSVTEKVATHTNGPWTYVMRATKTPCCDKTTLSIGYVKADTDHLEVAVLYHCDEHQEANARLIAAAPMMLDALREAADVLDDYSDVNDGDDGLPRPNKAMSALSIVEAAIARAEGR